MPEGICARCERPEPCERVSGGMLGEYEVFAWLCHGCLTELGGTELGQGAVRMWIRSIYVLMLRRRAAGPGAP